VLVIQLTLHIICQYKFFILKQGYMFRLKFSYLQALTTFSLPDALPTLGSHSVYQTLLVEIYVGIAFLDFLFLGSYIGRCLWLDRPQIF